jgi:hypothetical protein
MTGPLKLTLTMLLALAPVLACSPEARRVRDGGPGADVGNKRLVIRDEPIPHAADTTLWPGRAIAPVDLLARGIVPPPTYPAPGNAAPKVGQTPIKPNVPPSEAQHRTFDSGQTANPRRQTNER